MIRCLIRSQLGKSNNSSPGFVSSLKDLNTRGTFIQQADKLKCNISLQLHRKAYIWTLARNWKLKLSSRLSPAEPSSSPWLEWWSICWSLSLTIVAVRPKYNQSEIWNWIWQEEVGLLTNWAGERHRVEIGGEGGRGWERGDGWGGGHCSLCGKEVRQAAPKERLCKHNGGAGYTEPLHWDCNQLQCPLSIITPPRYNQVQPVIITKQL